MGLLPTTTIISLSLYNDFNDIKSSTLIFIFSPNVAVPALPGAIYDLFSNGLL